MSQKSYDKTATLYVVSTPIGNLDDITLRSIKILNEVEAIFAEDTRVTLKLLNNLNIKKKLHASHEHNEQESSIKMLEYLKSGYNIAVVSDRGTPIISDPGYILVKTAIQNGYNVVSLPGPTAFVPAITSSGIFSPRFVFVGFLDNKESKRIKELNEYKLYPETLVFYESPHRLKKFLENMLEVFGNRKISISREISKLYEEIYRGNVLDIINKISDVKGELVIVVEGNKEEKNYDHLTVIEHVNLYIKEGLSSKEAIKKVALDRNMKKNVIYDLYHINQE